MNIIEKRFETLGTMDYRQKTERIILHHADSSSCTVEDIDRWHKQNGWCKIGYHFFIDKQGNIYRGREENAVGAHAYGANYDSIGICAEGKYMQEYMPDVQKEAFVELIKYLKEKYNVSIVQGHRDVGNTTCPGKNFPLSEIIDLVKENNETKKAEGKISDIQRTLNSRYNMNIAEDNIYGNETKRALVKGLQIELNTQFGRGLEVDGIFGNLTKEACIEVKYGAKGNITYLIQAMLVCKSFELETDGIFGENTTNAVKNFQARNNLVVDGIVGKHTFSKLFK